MAARVLFVQNRELRARLIERRPRLETSEYGQDRTEPEVFRHTAS